MSRTRWPRLMRLRCPVTIAILASVCTLPVPAQPLIETTDPTGASAEPKERLPTSPVSEEAITAVPQHLLERVQREIVSTTESRQDRLEMLGPLLFSEEGLSLTYDGSRTRTLSESIRDHKANCLTFSLLFVALAREAGIEAHVQETDRVLAWQADEALYGNGHVNVVIRISGRRKIVDIDRSVVSTHGESRTISDKRALSHFYNNRGAELMHDGMLDAASQYFRKSIELSQEFVPAWNNLGVLAMRQNDLLAAEAAYSTALELDAHHAPTLANMVNLYGRSGDGARRKKFEQQLFKLRRRDPFHQIILAVGYEKSGNYVTAIQHYQRALRLKAKEHFVYFGLARAHAHLGQMKQATDALVRARKVAGNQRDFYQAKLDRLRGSSTAPSF